MNISKRSIANFVPWGTPPRVPLQSERSFPILILCFRHCPSAVRGGLRGGPRQSKHFQFYFQSFGLETKKGTDEALLMHLIKPMGILVQTMSKSLL